MPASQAIFKTNLAGARIEIAVPADGLFQLRLFETRSPLPRRPLAIPCQTSSDVGVRLRHIPGRMAEIRTERGLLHLDLRRGTWELRRRDGTRALASPPGMTGFESGRPHTSVILEKGAGIHGLGEMTGGFDKRGLTREFWNIDVLGHAPGIHSGLRSIYLSIPFGIMMRGQKAAGIFFDNPRRQIWDMGQTEQGLWKISADGGELNLFLFTGPELGNILERYTALTGRIPLPPRWALGYHQCRYGYRSRRELEAIARQFRRRRIPCDALYLDIHHMHGHRVFTFGKSFPQPRAMIAKLAKDGFKLVTIVDPGVKEDMSFPVWKRGRAACAFVKRPDGRADFIGKVWPGPCRFPDFLNPKTRAWWGREQALIQNLGVSGFWNDMNEPALFDCPGKTMPAGCRHFDGSRVLDHSHAHNLYGLEMARASYDSAIRHRPHERPFIISRAGYAGIQRYALVWTGDNSSTWEHMADSIPMLLSLGLSGAPFCGADTGGFLGDATGELLARWTQLAAFTPFFRNHSNVDSHPQEPWAFGPRVEAICRKFICLRYRLLPYLYCLFAGAHRHGTPIMRPMLWRHPNDPAARAASDQFMLGDSLLVAPILREGARERRVYLPRGSWYDFRTCKRFHGGRYVTAHAGLETIPLFVRGGAILPMGTVRASTSGAPDPVIEWHIWPGGDGRLDWLEDDGASNGAGPDARKERIVTASSRDGEGCLKWGLVQGAFTSPVRRWTVVVHSTGKAPKATIDGFPVRVRRHRLRRGFSFSLRPLDAACEAKWVS